MQDLRYATMLDGRPAVGSRVRRPVPSMLRRADNWSAVTATCADAIFAKVHGRRPEEEAS